MDREEHACFAFACSTSGELCPRQAAFRREGTAPSSSSEQIKKAKRGRAAAAARSPLPPSQPALQVGASRPAEAPRAAPKDGCDPRAPSPPCPDPAAAAAAAPLLGLGAARGQLLSPGAARSGSPAGIRLAEAHRPPRPPRQERCPLPAPLPRLPGEAAVPQEQDRPLVSWPKAPPERGGETSVTSSRRRLGERKVSR